MQQVRAHQYDFNSARIQRLDVPIVYRRPKWERALTTENQEESIDVDSKSFM